MRKPRRIWKLLGLLPVGVAVSVGTAASPHDQPAQRDGPSIAHASPSKQPSAVSVDGHGAGTLELFGFEGDAVTLRKYSDTLLAWSYSIRRGSFTSAPAD